MLKKSLSLVCALAMIVSVCGCGQKANNSETEQTGETEVGEFLTFEEGKDTSSATSGNTSADKSSNNTGNSNKPSGNTSFSQGSVTSNAQGGTQVTIERPDEPTVTKSQLASKDYKGKEFKILYWYTPDSLVKRKVEAFNKAHNANLKLEIVNDDPNVTVAKSIVSGKPYDIIASHGNYFPHTIFQDIYEPLEKYIAKEDMFDKSKPNNGGLSTVVNDTFAWGGHYYALGSAQSIYQNVIYYNKKLFTEAGLEDPWELYKKGKWTWSKFKEMGNQVTDTANGISFIQMDNMNVWCTVNAVSAVQLKNGTYVENLTSPQMVSVAQSWQDLFRGKNPLSVKPTGNPFNSGKTYAVISVTDSYDFYAKQVRLSSAFGRNVDNLGCVPVPYAPYNTSKKYPGHAPQGYSCTKGAKDPSVAACYALFESRYVDSNSSQGNMAEVRKEVQKLFAANGFIGMAGFEDSAGKSITDIINHDIGWKLVDGGNVTSMLNAQRQTLQRIIADSVKTNK